MPAYNWIANVTLIDTKVWMLWTSLSCDDAMGTLASSTPIVQGKRWVSVMLANGYLYLKENGETWRYKKEVGVHFPFFLGPLPQALSQ